MIGAWSSRCMTTSTCTCLGEMAHQAIMTRTFAVSLRTLARSLSLSLSLSFSLFLSLSLSPALALALPTHTHAHTQSLVCSCPLPYTHISPYVHCLMQMYNTSPFIRTKLMMSSCHTHKILTLSLQTHRTCSLPYIHTSTLN